MIEYEENKVVIHTENGKRFETKYLLCTIPPSLYNRIEWKPELNWMRQSISNEYPMGYVLKINTYYKTAWWKEDGLNGLSFVVNDNINENPVVSTLDDCKPDGSFPSIVGFIAADSAKECMAMSYEDRKQCVLKQYARVFGNNKAITECIGYEKIWNKENLVVVVILD